MTVYIAFEPDTSGIEMPLQEADWASACWHSHRSHVRLPLLTLLFALCRCLCLASLGAWTTRRAPTLCWEQRPGCSTRTCSWCAWAQARLASRCASTLAMPSIDICSAADQAMVGFARKSANCTSPSNTGVTCLKETVSSVMQDFLAV